jgi:hypothetical protein
MATTLQNAGVERLQTGEPTPAVADDPIRRIDVLEKNLARQIEAIRFSDAKITILAPTLTAMLGFLAATVPRAAPGVPAAKYALMGVVPLVLAYVFLALTVIPRISSGSRSRLFFGGIRHHTPDGYVEAMARMTTAEYIDELARDCHATAVIARRKNLHVRNAYLAFFVSLPFWAAAIFLLNGP